jgi:phosphoribosylformimino-5-aminoimidazole carboxamide ribotide isomerase
MKFRPCIDLHQGQVKQIVGSTLRIPLSAAAGSSASHQDKSNDTADTANQQTGADAGLQENFSTTRPASDFAQMYKQDGLTGGHVIMLGANAANKLAARQALAAYPGGLQVGGGITLDNALEWLEAGASHVIVTSYIFADQGTRLDYERLQSLVDLVGKGRLVLDLSCRRKPDDAQGPYYVVSNQWQTFTDCLVDHESLKHLAQYCSEFLVHGVEVEGQRCGILEDLVVLLQEASPIPVTYAGGVRDLQDMERVKEMGRGKVDCTIGSALDLFGGDLSYREVVEWHYQNNPRHACSDAQDQTSSEL